MSHNNMDKCYQCKTPLDDTNRYKMVFCGEICHQKYMNRETPGYSEEHYIKPKRSVEDCQRRALEIAAQIREKKRGMNTTRELFDN